uniref:1-phosphatidylinositol 4,5-bisphosphate phosphodiesterase eta-2 n=1 Tax=Panthera onca TaxID=9690 RepID=UPI002952D914|nr:1-phosphatidylinositol 4,5-bisphosphate phosphodiesterase eta-2 [Panthera onca]
MSVPWPSTPSRTGGTVACLAEALLWVGASVAVSPPWQLGPLVERCMSAMQAGTQMVKLRGSSKGLVRFYFLDEHRSCIRWRPSRKNEKAKISIDSIQEVSEGRQSEIFQRYPDGSFDPNCCFSIYHGSHRESLDLVSPSGDEARTWVTGLRYLMAGISDEDSLARRQRTRDQWLKQTFDEADKNGDGSLSIGEVLQLLHKLNVNLPRQRVKQMFQEADTDDHQGTLSFEEFCAFYKMMSTRRDLYLLMLTYSDHKDYLDAADLQRFLEVEQKMTGVTLESCRDIIEQFEPCPENKSKAVLGIDGFTNYTRSPAGDIFNPEHHGVHQDMTRPLSHYFITSSHNTYLVGDQLMSQSRVDMYAWVLQAGCRCVEVDCWDGPDGEPIVHHGYTLTSKILFKDVIETINKYAFVKNEYPVILSIENHCSVIQQKKMAQYLTDILGDKLDLSSVSGEDATMLPSPQMLKGKILVKGKKLPANISEDAEEGEVSDEDSADEIDEDCKLLNGDATTNRKRVENIAKRKLDSLMKESKIRDCEDANDFTVSTLPPSGKLGHKAEGKKAEDGVESGEDTGGSRRNNRTLMSSFSKRKKKSSKLKKAASMEEGGEDLESQGSQGRGASRQKKTVKLSRALSDLVKYTKSVGIHDVEAEVASSWQVSSFSETRAQQIVQQKPAQYLRFNQHQLSRIYPSSYRVDSSNYNPQPFWNAGCQMVALNYQSEGRMLQLNRAKFSLNGNCGYVLKPQCMCQGVFNPNSEDPLPGQLKKQLVLRIISGQQLPKPRDSMLGDRGEIIDPFVEVEVIGLPVDCNKEQTRVVDDNGFNPMWEETLVFTVHMPEIALVRFLVWDHDPIGRDFIGQRTLAFSSMMPAGLLIGGGAREGTRARGPSTQPPRLPVTTHLPRAWPHPKVKMGWGLPLGKGHGGHRDPLGWGRRRGAPWGSAPTRGRLPQPAPHWAHFPRPLSPDTSGAVILPAHLLHRERAVPPVVSLKQGSRGARALCLTKAVNGHGFQGQRELGAVLTRRRASLGMHGRPKPSPSDGAGMPRSGRVFWCSSGLWGPKLPAPIRGDPLVLPNLTLRVRATPSVLAAVCVWLSGPACRSSLQVTGASLRNRASCLLWPLDQKNENTGRRPAAGLPGTCPSREVGGLPVTARDPPAGAGRRHRVWAVLRLSAARSRDPRDRGS